MIDLQVRSETGEIVAHSTSRGIEWSDALAQIDQIDFPCLGGLLPYADTIFNERQVERLRREVATEPAREILGAEVASEVEALCRQVQDGTHLYLWFVGD